MATLCRPSVSVPEYGFEERNKVYVAEAKARVPAVVQRALDDAELLTSDIDVIIHVSCTGFMMPSLTAWLIDEMGFESTTRQLPTAQLGCAAGGAAINRAHDFCTAYPEANALIVACEFCSLCYQPTDLGIGNLLSNMEPPAPALQDLAALHGWDAADLDFYIVHAGGPRILDDLSTFLQVDPDAFRFSRATLTEYGNIASAVVLDVLRRLFGEGGVQDRARGLLAGVGPGITAEMALGRRQSTSRETA